MVKRKKEFISRPVAPEDVRAGEYISLLHEIVEYVPGCWCDVDASAQIEARRFMRWPTGECAPLRVVEVCLPYVFVRKPAGEYITLDTRRCRVAMLDRTYGRRVFGALARQARLKPKIKESVGDDSAEE